MKRFRKLDARFHKFCVLSIRAALQVGRIIALSPTMRGQAHVASAKYFVMASGSGIERLAVAVRDTIHVSSGLAGLLRDGHYQ